MHSGAALRQTAGCWRFVLCHHAPAHPLTFPLLAGAHSCCASPPSPQSPPLPPRLQSLQSLQLLQPPCVHRLRCLHRLLTSVIAPSPPTILRRRIFAAIHARTTICGHLRTTICRHAHARTLSMSMCMAMGRLTLRTSHALNSCTDKSQMALRRL